MILAVHLALAADPPARLDLWRGWPGSDKVYVRVGLPGGESGLFLVDTGATVSVLNRSTAERLGIQGQAGEGELRGLSGTVPFVHAEVPWLDLGGRRVDHVEMAVGVPGVPDEAGALPVDGILGNNVWSQFTLVVDYPRDTVELWTPGDYRIHGHSAALVQDANHLYTAISLTAESGGQRVEQDTTLEIDTGAGSLSLWCQTGDPFRALTTVGVEAVLGVGADLDRVPDYDVLMETRRIPVTHVGVGGRELNVHDEVRWSSPDSWTDACLVTPGLIGYDVLAGHRVVFDFHAGRFALERSRGRRRTFDAMAAWLAEDQARHGDDLGRAAPRARVLAAQAKYADARALVERALAVHPDDAELHVLLARLLRFQGETASSLATLADVAPAALAEQDEWVAYVNTLVLAGQVDEAVRRAQAAADGGGDDAARESFFLALSDAQLAAGRYGESRAALDRAIEVDQGGSAFAIRRARILAAEGDHYGALTTLRELLHAYPMGGQAIWLYGIEAHPEDRATFTADVARALSRLHPDMRPLDFVGAGRRASGDDEGGRAALAEGRARDCKPLPHGPDRDNCDAWYLALGGQDLARAASRIRAALAKDPHNAAFLDTATTVALAEGDRAAALRYATEAAWLQPWDPYLLWQRGRLVDAAPKDPG